ncbi:MAG: hypothetical protein ABW136_03960 [Steroidobacteraceae bacterium]
MNDFLSTTRREFLGMAAGAGAAFSAAAGESGRDKGSAVVVHDPDFAVPEQFVSGTSMTLVALRGDPVRLWRDGLRDTVAAGQALYGLTLWADLLIFRGLATELRRHLRVVRQDPVTGRFAWMIA